MQRAGIAAPDPVTLLSTKPYLIRAIHEWCLDQGFTPYLQVAVDERCRVPREHIRDGHIVLNVSLTATNQLTLGNDNISFQARFNGAVFSVLVPVDAVAAIYARENGQGMAFDVVPAAEAPPPATGPEDTEPPKPPSARGSHLTRIK